MCSDRKKVEEAICLDCNVLKLPQVTLIGLSGGVGRGCGRGNLGCGRFNEFSEFAECKSEGREHRNE